MQEQLTKEPRPFPQLQLNAEVRSIDGFKFEDFTLLGYNPHPPIKMDMAV